MDKMEPNIQEYKGMRWQVIFSFLLSWLCHLVSGQIHYSIVEERRKDSVIANISEDLGLDIKQLSSRNLKIVSPVFDKYLYINLSNGNLYMKDRIDREILCGTAATCFLTFDAVVENPFNIFNVKIEIDDINDNYPYFFHKDIILEVIELTVPGARFVLENAEDPDIGINSVQTYRLSDNQYFTLNEKTRADGSKFPELVLEKLLDRETQTVHELILTALDGGSPVKSGTASVKIIVTDSNDNAPVFIQDLYKVILKENVPINSTVVVLNATDRDEGVNSEITYSFTKTSGDLHHTEIFSIHPTTGEIKTNRHLDFEVTKTYELSVQAKDGGGLAAHSKVLVEVIDVNDNVPEISINSFNSPIPEDCEPGTMIALIKVHDQDSGESGEVDVEILEEIPFRLLSSNSYYRIVTSNALDREKVSSFSITILATDRGSPPLSSRRVMRLEILDVNDNPPIFDKSSYVVYVPENNLPGTSVCNVQASDPDTGDNSKIIYSLLSTNTEDLPVSSYLSINIETGVLYAQRSFDYEQHKEFLIQVTARDNGSPSLSSNATLIIRIVDQNDNAPRILYPSPESGGSAVFEMVPFASDPGSLISKVVAVDEDCGHNAWLSYYFVQPSEQCNFVISQHSGEIRTSRFFQEKDILKCKLVVMVKDNGDPALSATVTLSLIVGDNIQEVAPKFNNPLKDEDPPSSLQLYLVIALALISLLFIVTVMLVIVSKCKESKSAPTFSSLSTNLYPPVDPRMLSMYSDGTLPFPYSYNVCVALDSSESDFAYMKSNQNVPVENLIDADDLGLGNESLQENNPVSSLVQVRILKM